MPISVLHLLWGLETGGVQTMIATLARHSPAARARHTIVAFNAGGAAEPLLRAAGCNVAFLPKLPGFDPTLPRRLRALMDALKPALVHAHDFTGAFWSRMALGHKPQQVFVVSDHLAFQKLGGFKRRLYGICLRAADRVVVLSRPTRTGLARLGVPMEKLVLLRIGPEISAQPGAATRSSLRAALNLCENDFVVLTCARLEAQKNLLWFIRLAGRLVKRDACFKFLVSGHGSLRARLEQEIARQRLGANFHLLGLRGDVPDLLAAADVFALPSRLEELPLAALEAMRSGLPLAVSAVGALPEIIEASGAGRSLPVSRFEPWQDWLLTLAHNPGQRLETGRMGIEYIKANLLPEHGAAAMLELYEKCCAEKFSSNRLSCYSISHKFCLDKAEGTK